MTEPGACATCGSALAPGKRFCTRCGAAVAQAPPAEIARAAGPTEAPPARSAPTRPVRRPARPTRKRPWALDTPPANEPWWRNPVVLVATLVTLVLGGGGVASWRFFIAASDTASVVHVLPSITSPSTAPTRTAPAPEPDVATTVARLRRILLGSEAGRRAALQHRDYAAALRNRRALLAALDRLGVPAGPEQLRRAYATLRAAIRASARADAEHLACGCAALQPADVVASRLKRRFVILFDPYARRYLGGPIDANRI